MAHESFRSRLDRADRFDTHSELLRYRIIVSHLERRRTNEMIKRVFLQREESQLLSKGDLHTLNPHVNDRERKSTLSWKRIIEYVLDGSHIVFINPYSVFIDSLKKVGLIFNNKFQINNFLIYYFTNMYKTAN